MYLLQTTFDFEAAHVLPLHKGKCKQMHGHHWTVQVALSASSLATSGPATNMVLDFGSVRQLIQPLQARMDHTVLNEALAVEQPTCEWLAGQIYQYLAENLKSIDPEGRCQVFSVEVTETPGSSAMFLGNWK